MSKRNEWTFAHKSEALEEACQVKEDRHGARIKFWTKEKALAEKRFDKATVTIKKVQITGGERREAMIDQSLQARLNECVQRLTFHEQKRDEYRSWRRAFHAAGVGIIFHLQHDDVTYFGLGESEKDIAE